MKKTNESRHCFRAWAQSLDYIVQFVCNQAPLIDDHKEQQLRVANPAWQWARELALAVIHTGQAGTLLETHQLADIAYQANVTIPGLGVGVEYDCASDAERRQVLLQIGRKLNTTFGESDEISIDGISIKRTSARHHDKSEKLRSYKQYCFSSLKESVDVPQISAVNSADGLASIPQIPQKN